MGRKTSFRMATYKVSIISFLASNSIALICVSAQINGPQFVSLSFATTDHKHSLLFCCPKPQS